MIQNTQIQLQHGKKQSLHIRRKTMRQRKRGAVRAKIDLLSTATRGKNE